MPATRNAHGRNAHGRWFVYDGPGRWHTTSADDKFRWDLTRRTNTGNRDDADTHGEDPGWYVQGPGQLSTTWIGDHCTDFESAMGHAAQVALDYLAGLAAETLDRKMNTHAAAARVAGVVHDGDCPGIGRPCCNGSLRAAATPTLSHDDTVADGIECPGQCDAPECHEEDDGPLVGQASLHELYASETFADAARRLGVELGQAIALAVAPSGDVLRLAIDTDDAIVGLMAVVGPSIPDHVELQVRRRYADTGMTLPEAYRSVTRDIAAGAITP